MGIVPTLVTNGTAMSRGDVGTELGRIRSWINGGIVAGDIDTEVVEASHIARSEVFGYPRQALEAEARHAYDHRPRAEFVSQVGPERWCLKSQRRWSFFLNVVGDQPYAVPDMCDRVRTPKEYGGFATVRFQWAAATFYNQAEAGAPLYPTLAGSFRIRYTPLSTGVAAYVTGSLRYLPVTPRTATYEQMIGQNGYLVVAQVDLVQDEVYDFALEFTSERASAAIDQVVVLPITATVELSFT
jgi:hypothetical protein